MCDKYFTKRNIYVLSSLVLLVLLLAGCGGTNSTASVSTSLANNATATSATIISGGNSATATLKHQPVGTATLSWDHTTHMLTVQIMLSGLAPNSIHPVRIDQGICGYHTGSYDTTLYSLANITADAHGVANASSKVKVPSGIPAKNWYLDVHNGPALANTAETASIACVDIVNHDTSLRSAQTAQANFQPTAAASQNANGTAQLSLSGHTLTVKLEVAGLAPRTDHMVHIHAGSCLSQGAVIYPLTTLKANAAGKATSTTTIQNVTTIPANGWYVNVHDGTDLSTQTGFDPITCGDIALK